MEMEALSLKMANSVKSYYRPGDMKWHYEHGLVLYASLRAGIIMEMIQFTLGSTRCMTD